MVHLRYMAEDGWTGRSPIEVAAETFGIALAGQEAAGRAAGGQSFKLAANLAAFDSDDEEYERARARLKNAMRRDADGQVLIAGPDDKFSVLGMSAADIQLLQSRKFDREQIAALYRVPPSKLQMLENGVKANGEQQALDYKADCLTHWGGFIEAELGLTLLTERERRAGMVLRHEYDALLVSTLKERVDAFSKACGGPFMSPDEVRPYFKKGPIEGGAKLYPPSNMTREEDTEKKGESE
jgi:HK97 family phage portal protein